VSGLAQLPPGYILKPGKHIDIDIKTYSTALLIWICKTRKEIPIQTLAGIDLLGCIPIRILVKGIKSLMVIWTGKQIIFFAFLQAFLTAFTVDVSHPLYIFPGSAVMDW